MGFERHQPVERGKCDCQAVPEETEGAELLHLARHERVAGRILFAVFMLVPFAIVGFFALFYPTAILVLFGLLLAVPACVIALLAKTPRELLLVLQLASITALVYGVGLGLVFAL